MMYYYMTRELMKICPSLLVCQEGGYNTDFLGQHASGVAKALLGKEFDTPTQADIDAGFNSFDDLLNGKECLPWAKNDVEETRKHIEKYWNEKE